MDFIDWIIMIAWLASMSYSIHKYHEDEMEKLDSIEQRFKMLEAKIDSLNNVK